MSGTLANERLAALAAEVGWPSTETNLAFVLDADVAAGWTRYPLDDGLRPATNADLGAIGTLHEAEFPASYLSASELLARAGRGEQLVLVAGWRRR